MIRNDTVAYYDNPDNNYATKTINADMSQVYSHFLKYLPEKASILDAGCGSGRDSLFFINEGFVVTAIDASKVMCDAASKTINQPVLHQNFYEINFDHCFDGIWACASLLHIPEADLPMILQRMFTSLLSGGVLYASWKYGKFERVEEGSGRFFCDMDECKIKMILSDFPDVCLKECWISNDVRDKQNDQKWINVIIEKSELQIMPKVQITG